jgi:hypothetical protein
VAVDTGPCGPETESEIEGEADVTTAAIGGVSGLYEARGPASAVGQAEQVAAVLEGDDLNGAEAEGSNIPTAAKIKLRETLRLDVDGRYPQMAASGTIFQFLTERTHWVAKVKKNPDGSYEGPIWYKDGDVSAFPYTTVHITTKASFFPNLRSAKVKFSGGGPGKTVQHFRWVSRYFRPCEFEYDTVQGTEAVTDIKTHAHPTRPAGLPSEKLSIEQVFRRAGFNVSKSGGDVPIPLINAGPDELWTNSEMHDAMQTFWSRFADRAQWSVWTLFAALHEDGEDLGGIMFDDIGPNHRQGTAVFNESFIKVPPAGDTQPDAWIRRMRFWTAVHEMGHTFNLAHSWQKVHPPAWGTPWTPLTNEPEARSFMNYPYYVGGGQSAFFDTFEYRFSDQELLFMRHAPERFVQHGNAAWFDHHGFEQTRRMKFPSLQLELRANRTSTAFQFMEPVVLELKLTNVSNEPQLLEEHILSTADRMTVAIKREGRPARQHAPYSQRCWHSRKRALTPQQSMYESLFVAAGMNGWDVAEPGRYVVQVALHLDDEDIISNPLPLRISAPQAFEEEDLAQDLFTEDVGRTLAFDGTRALNAANDTLKLAVDKFPKHPVAVHAGVALGTPLVANFKELRVDPKAPPEKRLQFAGQGEKLDEAEEQLAPALLEDPTQAARSLGHIDYAESVERFSVGLAKQGEVDQAQGVQRRLVKTLADRGVRESIRQQVERKVAKAIAAASRGDVPEDDGPDDRAPSAGRKRAPKRGRAAEPERDARRR